MRRLLRGMRLPSHQRPEAIDHAVMLHNLLSSSSLPNNASPRVLWTGKLGNTKMLRVFGCMVQYRPHTARAGRFSQRAQWGLHLGIEKHYNAWKIFDIHSKETVAARDVIFYERLTLQTHLDNLAANRDLTGGFRGNRAFASVADEADWDEQNVDGASEEARPLPYCSVPIPMDDENHRESVNAETYFDFAGTGYVTPQPVDTNISERIGPNFLPDPEAGDEAAYPEDTNLPRYTQSGLQILGLVTAKLRQIDVANAFLYVPVDAEIFVELPHGSNGDPNQVCQLEKSLYGIKQAPRLWQQHLHARLIRIGFLQLPHDQGMYRLTKGTDYTLLIVYVDDLLYIGSNDAITTWFGGDLQRDLTLTVATTTLSLNDSDSLQTSSPRHTATPTEITKSPPYSNPAGIRDYQRKLGCLLFADITCRPDLSYSASQLATYLKKPEAEHMLELDRALHYLVSTPTIGLTYHKIGTTTPKLIDYVDADHAGDSDNRRSRTGYIYRLEPIRPIS
ncbi:unnamed protein product [Closterium sp. NIES-54]